MLVLPDDLRWFCLAALLVEREPVVPQHLPFCPPDEPPTAEELAKLAPLLEVGATPECVMALLAFLRKHPTEAIEVIERATAVLRRSYASRRPITPVRRPDGDRGFSVVRTTA